MSIQKDQMKSFIKKNYINIVLLVAIVFGFAATYALAVSNVVSIKAKYINVRTGPMLSYNVMGQLKQGDKIQVLKKQNGWYMVRLDGDKIGWIASWLTDSTEIDSATNTVGVINTDNTNIREYATTNSKILKQLRKGEQINVVYSKGEWSQIITNSQVGWINNKLFDLADNNTLEKETVLKNVYVMEPLSRLHSAPNPNSTVIANLKQQSKLTVLGSQGDYYKVKNSNNIVGFIARKMVTTQIPDPIKIIRPNTITKATIVLDAGHGGNDPGAQANDQEHYEKSYTLLFIKTLKQKLENAGAHVIMVRNDDRYVSLEDRVELTNKVKPNAFISIHFDSSSQANQASGMTTYYYSKKTDLKLAKTISSQLNDLNLSNRGVNFGDFEVLRDIFYPSVLIELGYINSDNDFSQITSRNYRNQVTDKILESLKNYFK